MQEALVAESQHGHARYSTAPLGRGVCQGCTGRSRREAVPGAYTSPWGGGGDARGVPGGPGGACSREPARATPASCGADTHWCTQGEPSPAALQSSLVHPGYATGGKGGRHARAHDRAQQLSRAVMGIPQIILQGIAQSISRRKKTPQDAHTASGRTRRWGA